MKIYYKLDEFDRVIPCCDYAEGLVPDEDWKLADLAEDPYEEHYIPVYKEVDGTIMLRTAAEIQDDIDAIPIPEPTETEQLRADVDFLTMENEYLEEQGEIDRADIDYLLMLVDE